ncbi:MAG: hypothetical protein WCC60_06885 [Ilumatobacteraceae bacterium]
MEDPVAEQSYLLLAETMEARSRTDMLPAISDEVPAVVAGVPVLSGGDEPRQSDLVQRAVAPRPSSNWFARAAQGDDGSNHHTTLPRLMVITSMLAALGSPLLFGALYRQGHFDVVGTDYYIDDRGRKVATAAAVAIVVCYNLGWWWWTMASSLNARKKARYTVSPWFGTIVMILTVGCIVLLPRAIEAQRSAPDTYSSTLAWCLALVALPIVAHFAMLTAYRRAARAVGATQTPWTFISMLPFVMVGLNLLSRFFTRAIGDSYLTVTGIANLAFVGMYVMGLYQAMSSFDRACAGRQMAHTDRADLAEFISRSR